MNYSVVIGNPDLAKLYGVDAMPMTLLIDRDGKVAASHVGMVDKNAFESEIQILLKDSASKSAK
jgi:thioredoxin-related protein